MSNIHNKMELLLSKFEPKESVLDNESGYFLTKAAFDYLIDELTQALRSADLHDPSELEAMASDLKGRKDKLMNLKKSAGTTMDKVSAKADLESALAEIETMKVQNRVLSGNIKAERDDLTSQITSLQQELKAAKANVRGSASYSAAIASDVSLLRDRYNADEQIISLRKKLDEVSQQSSKVTNSYNEALKEKQELAILTKNIEEEHAMLLVRLEKIGLNDAIPDAEVKQEPDLGLASRILGKIGLDKFRASLEEARGNMREKAYLLMIASKHGKAPKMKQVQACLEGIWADLKSHRESARAAYAPVLDYFTTTWQLGKLPKEKTVYDLLPDYSVFKQQWMSNYNPSRSTASRKSWWQNFKDDVHHAWRYTRYYFKVFGSWFGIFRSKGKGRAQ